MPAAATTTYAYDSTWFFFGTEALVVSTTTASVSTISSIFVMSFILRSKNRLTSAYHRIMFHMSLWDAISSFGMALATIPMPKDVGNMYPFVGRSFGNRNTCQVQGFFIVLGWLLVIMSNCVLNLYYACTFYFGMSEAKANSRLLPIAMAISISLALPTMILYLTSGYLSPQPFGPFCMLGPYPEEFSCETNENDSIIQCLAEGLLLDALTRIFIVSVLCIVFMAIVISLLLVVYATYRVERDSRRVARAQENENFVEMCSSCSTSEEELENTHTALREALMYIAAFVLTWIWLVIISIVGDENGSTTFWAILLRCQTFFQPLQGFFNAAIFVYHKVRLTRKAESDLSIYQALQKVLRTPWEVPELILSQIDLLGEGIQEPQDDPAIAPAIISSEFESIDTPSVPLSAGVSSKGLTSNLKQQNDSSKTSDNYKNSASNSSNSRLRPSRKYYSMPQGWWEVDNIAQRPRTNKIPSIRKQKLVMASAMAQRSDLESDV